MRVFRDRRNTFLRVPTQGPDLSYCVAPGAIPENIRTNRPLFPSRNGNGRKRMTRRAVHNVLKSAFIAAGLNWHLATHSLSL